MPANDLSDLNSATPGATDAASGGDDVIREFKTAVKNTVGGTDSGTGTAMAEHFLKGFHKFPAGDDAASDAGVAGNANRLFLNTSVDRIERDSGTAWVMLHAVQVRTQRETAGFSLIGTYVDLASLAVDVPTGAYVELLAVAQVTSSGAADSRLRFYDSTAAAALDDECYVNLAGGPMTVVHVGYATGLSKGSHTIALQGKVTGGLGTTVAIRRLIVKVF